MLTNTEHHWQTNDMVTAVYLSYLGFEYQVYWGVGSCVWQFEKSFDLLSDVEKFSAGHAAVEPKQFNRKFALMKREMFNIDGAPKNKG